MLQYTFINQACLLKGEAIEWPEKGLVLELYLIKDKMYEGAKGEDQEPVYSSLLNTPTIVVEG